MKWEFRERNKFILYNNNVLKKIRKKSSIHILISVIKRLTFSTCKDYKLPKDYNASWRKIVEILQLVKVEISW